MRLSLGLLLSSSFMLAVPALAQQAPADAIRLADDPAYASAIESLGEVPDDAGVVYWIDAARLADELVDAMQAEGRIGRTEAAIGHGAASGVDGALLWVRTSGTPHCMADINVRISIPTN